MIIKSFFGIDNKTYFKEYKKFAVNFEKEICIIKNNLKQHKNYSIKIDIDGRDQFKGYLYCYFFENKRKNISFDNVMKSNKHYIKLYQMIQYSLER